MFPLWWRWLEQKEKTGGSILSNFPFLAAYTLVYYVRSTLALGGSGAEPLSDVWGQFIDRPLRQEQKSGRSRLWRIVAIKVGFFAALGRDCRESFHFTPDRVAADVADFRPERTTLFEYELVGVGL